MKLSISPMSKESSVETTLWFQTDETTEYWREPLFYAYPNLDKEKGLNAPWNVRKTYLESELSKIYSDNENEIYFKANEFQKYWDENQSEIENEFSRAFKTDCSGILNDMWAEVSLNPIYPRWLKERGFSIYWKSGTDRFIATAIHEIIHFVWFDIWQNHFKDDTAEYNQPHLKWLLSEMVVHTIVNNSGLKKFFTEKELQKVVYDYFYNISISGKPILETLLQLYGKSDSIIEFMENAYKYVQKNEIEIRKQVL